MLIEIAQKKSGHSPDPSFGTHFFQDLVETNIFYCALFPEKEGVVLNDALFAQFKNLLTHQIPKSRIQHDVINVYDIIDNELKVMSDVVSQQIVCFLA